MCNVKKPAIRGGSRTVITSKMELFVTVGYLVSNSFQLLTIFTMSSTLVTAEVLDSS